MPDEPLQLPTCARPSHRLLQAAQWVPALVALLTAAAILALIAMGNTEPIQAVAAFGAATAVGGAATTVTVTIVRR
ncbi:hypothetical protein [Streptomyces sp. V1I1]|uniref:hypothetical protein n=1 Tax=Streptomyces sp. V1I1 TaxID=3042272 RepID=UPI0027808500|nr:hypothetical protein [Streptomyces sp. V1I1]MDQ0938580.1 hypothetical protein [Streptomyces sp. V1I1]